MKLNLFPKTSSKKWLVEEKQWSPEKQTLNETIFALGNGYLGSRGILEEIPDGSTPGTYFAGLYDNKNTQVTELVNAPNPIHFKISVNGETLDVSKMKVISHYHALDMKRAALVRETIFRGKDKTKYSLETIRFFSMHEKHCVVMRVLFTPLDKMANIEVESIVDDSITNKGILTEGDKMHYVTREKRMYGKVNYLSDVTFEKKYTLVFASRLFVEKDDRELSEYKESFGMKVKKNQTACFTKFIMINSTRDRGITDKNIRKKTIDLLKFTVDKGFDQVFIEHWYAWRDLWEKSDIQLDCKGEQQRAMRFNIYHLLILANPDDENASIGARALSAEGYKGHVFWDTELFMLPFYIYTCPDAARSLIMYRYNRLDAARSIATGRGYRGAQFPWESADKGFEETPKYTVDLDGRMVKTIIGEEEHIVSDVAYAVWHYYSITNDKKFMWKYGLEMLLETAQFWVSRGSYDKKSGTYAINGVMGCDEFHANTNNNAFTNGMAAFTISVAMKCLGEFENRSPKKILKLLEKLQISKKAINKWGKVADAIKTSPVRKDKIIEEFDGYFKLNYFPLPKRDAYSIPGLPEKHVSVKDLCKTQYVKQGDTLILLYLLSDQFDHETKKANYFYYDDRTLHKSSLSPSTHAIIGAEIGDMEKSYNYFLACLYTDIHDLYHNTSGGMHSASLGASWQVVVNGFCGMRLGVKGVSFHPHIPDEIGGVRFNITMAGKNIQVYAKKDRISFLYETDSKKSIDLHAFGDKITLIGGKKITVKNKQES